MHPACRLALLLEIGDGSVGGKQGGGRPPAQRFTRGAAGGGERCGQVKDFLAARSTRGTFHPTQGISMLVDVATATVAAWDLCYFSFYKCVCTVLLVPDVNF